MQIQKSIPRLRSGQEIKIQNYNSKIKSVKTFNFLLVLLTFNFCLLTLPVPVFAQSNDLGQSQITPVSPLYFLKSVREIIELKVAGTARVKALRQLEFATRRIREANSLVQTSREDLIEATLPRYLFHLDQLNNVVNFSDEIVASHITDSVILHMSALQSIYNKVTNTRAQMSIRTTVYRLTLRDQDFVAKLHKLSKPHLAEKITPSLLSGCKFLAKIASSSPEVVLNEVTKAVLSERAEKCLTPSL